MSAISYGDVQAMRRGVEGTLPGMSKTEVSSLPISARRVLANTTVDLFSSDS